jgi:hypothetical protein
MGTKPVHGLVGLCVVGLLMSGCRNGMSGGGYYNSPSSQAGMNYSSSPTGTRYGAGMTTMGSQRPATTTESAFGQPMPNAQTFPNATPGASAATSTSIYSGANAFSSQPQAPATMPSTATYQMQGSTLRGSDNPAMTTPQVSGTPGYTTTPGYSTPASQPYHQPTTPVPGGTPMTPGGD